MRIFASLQTEAFPAPWTKAHKFWPAVANYYAEAGSYTAVSVAVYKRINGNWMLIQRPDGTVPERVPRMKDLEAQ